MILNADIFYSKLMLFGEYSVIMGSMALSVPYGHFKGELSFINEDKYTDLNFAISSNKVLEDFLLESRGGRSNAGLEKIISLEGLQHDIQKGLYFESTIPQGYGLGSSGALVAAIYSRYTLEPRENPRLMSPLQLQNLKNKLSRLEAYFHGSSSGLDPLSCYVKFPLLIKNNRQINIVGLPRNKLNSPGGIFLINTGRPRKTEHLVNEFMNRIKDPEFAHKFKENYIAWNNKCITSLALGDLKEFSKNLALLSRFQLKNMTGMVPKDFARLWEDGIQSREFYLKLCGAGGGGFILGFTEKLEKVTSELEKNYQVITVYKSNGRFV